MTVRRVRDADSIDVASRKPIVVFGRMRGELTAKFDSSRPATGLLAAGISILVDDSTMSKILQSGAVETRWTIAQSKKPDSVGHRIES